MDERLTGVFTALVTPFHADGSFDGPAMARLVDRQVDAGVAGVVACGTTGEAAAMEPEEHVHVVEAVVAAAAGRVPVIAGAGSNRTAQAVALSRDCVRAGADALLHVTPYYVKPTQQGLVDHFHAVADATDRPVILYNVPSRTSVTMAPETVLQLAEDSRFVAVKQAVADLDQAAAILRGRPDRFTVLSGEDSLALPMIALGADGVIAVISNEVPAAFVSLVRAALGGDRATAAELHGQLFGLMKANFIESNPIPVKFAMAEMGLIANVLRTPMTTLLEPHHAAVRAALQQARVIETTRIVQRGASDANQRHSTVAGA